MGIMRRLILFAFAVVALLSLCDAKSATKDTEIEKTGSISYIDILKERFIREPKQNKERKKLKEKRKFVKKKKSGKKKGIKGNRQKSRNKTSKIRKINTWKKRKSKKKNEKWENKSKETKN